MSVPKFYLRLPGKDRPTFRIYRDGHPLLEPRIDAINTSMLKGTLDLTSAKEEAYRALRGLKEAVKPKTESYPDKNLDVLSLALKSYRKKDHTPQAQKMGEASLRRCIGLLGQHILYSVDLGVLEDLLSSLKPSARPKVAIFMNYLLHAAERAERLKVPAQPNPDILYLTKEEFLRVVEHIDPKLKLPVLVAFVTGCRQGEVFGISNLRRKGSIWLTQQMFPDGSYGPIKGDRPGRSKNRWVTVMPWGKSFVEEWIGCDHDSRFMIRGVEWAEVVREACKRVFPSNPRKHLTFRDLRHCYAIYYLDRGASVTHVKKSMGNSEAVLVKHYEGFIQTDAGEDALLSLG